MGRKKSPARVLDLSPEVEWYLESRGYEMPTCIPKFRTPEPRNEKGARFDPELVDKKINALKHLRHTKGKWAGKPLVLDTIQVAYFIAPVFDRLDRGFEWVNVPPATLFWAWRNEA